MAFSKRSLIALAVAAGAMAIVPACSNGSLTSDGASASDTTGSVGLNLTTGGEVINAVNMVVSGPTPVTKLINTISANATISAFVGALLPGAYTVTLTATAANTGHACTGNAAFNVTAGGTQSVTVAVTCGTGTTTTSSGNAIINGQVTNATDCAHLTQVIVAPLQVGVGESLDISSVATGGTGVHTTTWTSATDGSFDAGFTQYTCTSPGSKTLTVSLTKAGTTCLDTLPVTVNCVDTGVVVDAGAGGAPGVDAGGGSTGGAVGVGGALSLCTPPQVPVDSAACQACEANNCDPAAVCSVFVASADQTLCNAALDCARRTGCVVNSSADCYCGLGVDIVTCKASAANATGLCKAEITAGMPAGASATQIVNSLADVTLPAGNAMNLAQCDVSFCGDPAFGGQSECAPYCH